MLSRGRANVGMWFRHAEAGCLSQPVEALLRKWGGGPPREAGPGQATVGRGPGHLASSLLLAPPSWSHSWGYMHCVFKKLWCLVFLPLTSEEGRAEEICFAFLGKGRRSKQWFMMERGKSGHAGP